MKWLWVGPQKSSKAGLVTRKPTQLVLELCKFKAYNVLIWYIYILQDDSHQSVSWHLYPLCSYHCVSVMRAFKTHPPQGRHSTAKKYKNSSLSSFQVNFSIVSYNHPCCTEDGQKLTLTRNVCPLTHKISPFPPVPSPWQLSLYTLFLFLKLNYFSVNYMIPFVWPYFLFLFVDLKKCTMWELQAKLHLGQNEDCSPGDSTSDSSERWLWRGSGEGECICVILVKGEYMQLSTYLSRRFLPVSET